MRVVAIIMVRNGEQYVNGCLSHLQDQGIDAAVLDHGSTDNTYDLCQSWLGQGICYLQKIPYQGYFSLAEQLNLKRQVLEELEPDWSIHQDIDECLESPVDFESLVDWIRYADANNFNALNFEELVFIPYVDPDDSFYNSRYYYYFKPAELRLMRCWKNSADLSNTASGGHTLKGHRQLYPESGYLRHYIFTSQEHAYNKYAGRPFSEEEIQAGWHRNRINIPLSSLKFPEKSRLNLLPTIDYRPFNLSSPWKTHYWQT